MLYYFSFQLSDSQTPQALIGIILFDADLSVYGVEGGGGGIWVAGCSAPLVFHSSVRGGIQVLDGEEREGSFPFSYAMPWCTIFLN